MQLDDVLLAVEGAVPGDAAEAVTSSIRVSLGAWWVSFLVADMGGRALVRLAHVPIADLPGERRQDEDVAMVLPFDGGPLVRARSRSAGQPSGCWRSPYRTIRLPHNGRRLQQSACPGAGR